MLYAVCIGVTILSLIALNVDAAFAFIDSHVATSLSLNWIAFALMTSQFLYSSTPAATSAPMMRMTGATVDIIIGPKMSRFPIALDSVPMTINSGPIAATAMPTYVMIFCVRGSSSLNLLISSAAF